LSHLVELISSGRGSNSGKIKNMGELSLKLGWFA